ncbi:hypothetical protein [Aureispira anguillae]|uniref:Uncharacterized protein n=1 Tax=Aureispira anguillae TaxID=2864201 RepID=A0A915YE18_9BACT|nr:hypothetical protein [Aureispira anguillae]BDS11383.1 hypothetical protein AsAng_0020970 [Aureispira anguillae]
MKSKHKNQSKLLRKIKEKSERAALLAESNYARNFGWYIELNGEIIGELIKCRFEDMFWDSYEIIPQNTAAKKILFDSEKLLNSDFRFKNKRLNEYAPNAFLGGSQNLLLTKKRIIVRALYLRPKDIVEEKLLRKVGELLQRLPEEEKQISSKKFEFIKLTKNTSRKNIDSYFIEIYTDGNIRCIDDHQAPQINRYEYKLKKSTINEIQKLIDDYRLLDLKPSKINTSKIFNWLVSKTYQSDIYTIEITNELFEKFLKFKISLFNPSESQKKLIDCFNQIETLARLGLPESS